MTTKEYTDKELIEELTIAIEALGGTLIAVSESNGRFFRLAIDEDLQEQAQWIVNTIADKYKKKRRELMLNNPFVRAKRLREEIYG